MMLFESFHLVSVSVDLCLVGATEMVPTYSPEAGRFASALYPEVMGLSLCSWGAEGFIGEKNHGMHDICLWLALT